MTTDESKLEILRKVENGTLTVEEGSDLIAILDRAGEEPEGQKMDAPVPPETPIEKQEMSGCWKVAWSMFLVAGALLAGLSSYWIYQGYQKNGLGWGFWLSWIPMLIGIGLIILGWALLESPCMHVKINSKGDHHQSDLDISIPVPFNLAKWTFRNFGRYMPREFQGEDFLNVLDQAEISIKNGESFQVQLDNKDDDTKVDIFIN